MSDLLCLELRIWYEETMWKITLVNSVTPMEPVSSWVVSWVISRVELLLNIVIRSELDDYPIEICNETWVNIH